MTIYLRKANKKDIDLLFKWANDEDVRKNAFISEPISFCNHEKWFYDKLESSNCEIYIAYDQVNNAIGQLRIDIDGCVGLIDYSIDKEERNKGYGTKLLLNIYKILACESLNIKRLVGRVKRDNIPSQKAFEKAGFSFCKYEEYIEYYKEL